MTENRALCELVEKWRRKSSQIGFVYGNDYAICADELAAILDRPVVVSDADTQRACIAFYGHEKDPSCADFSDMRAALESMVRGKS